ncbi:sulfatase family protein [Agromyces sp. SYSU T00194]|uniref:sulfatase family protein n=1 Tax=Agromyces chitinivorans TaxID=3158560 RepID=UPI003392758D
MAEPSPAPDIVLIHCHDLGRMLGAYGARVPSPRIDAFANDAVRFDGAFATAPQCSPSRAALFTGRYPHETGVLGLTHLGWDLGPDVRHLAAILAEQGYRTELLGVHHESRVRPDLEVAARLGFDTVDTLGPSHPERRAELVADRAVAALERLRGAGPFYLQVGFLEPHRLHDPDPDATIMGFTGGWIEPEPSDQIEVPPYLEPDAGSRTELAELAGAIRSVDSQIGRVLDAIDRLGMSERTIVVLTTDHGLALPGAKGTLRDPGLETALILRAPSLGWTGGVVVEGLASNVDIVPTLLDAIGSPIPPESRGASLRPAIAAGATSRSEIFGEFTYHDYYDPARCIRTDRYKLILHFDRTLPHSAASTQSWRPRSTPLDRRLAHPPALVELYDLAVDPEERINLADRPERAIVVRALLGRLREWMRDTDDPLLDGVPPSPAHGGAIALLEGAAHA